MAVVIHSGAEPSKDMSESSAREATVKALQRSHRFKTIFNRLGLSSKVRRIATEALIAIAAKSGTGSSNCLMVEESTAKSITEATNAITFTDEDMEVQYPDHR